jgi:pimeloyl-ACP methyl ester carboxylesterase
VLLPAPLLLWLGRPGQRAGWGWASLVLVLAGIGLFGAILFFTPAGTPPPDSPVRHRFTGPAGFPRYTLANIVPEIEQFNLGLAVMPYLDRFFTREQARRVGPFTLALYREMEQDPNFHQLGSVQGWAYAELFGLPFNVGHYYLYVPKNRPAGPRPALVFLHGSLGNFKTYTWIWSRLAEREGLVIIAPSYGFGNWRAEDSIAVVSAALADAATQVEIDPDRVYLAGLSNGGLGVSHLALAQPERFRGLIFLSPVMDTRIVSSPAFLERWRGRPVLVITGAADERIPLAYVRQRVVDLQAGGVAVTEKVYPGEDHFLFFSQPEPVLAEVQGWLETN